MQEAETAAEGVVFGNRHRGALRILFGLRALTSRLLLTTVRCAVTSTNKHEVFVADAATAILGARI